MNAKQRRTFIRELFSEWRKLSEDDKECELVDLSKTMLRLEKENAELKEKLKKYTEDF